MCSEDTSQKTMSRPLVLLFNTILIRNLGCQDRIFALLAISSDAKELDIVPNYSASYTISRLCLDLSARLLKTSTNLGPLVYACRWAPSFDDAVPSWVINVHRRGNAVNLPWGILAPHPRTSLKNSPCLTLDRSVQVFKGRIIDYIAMPALPLVSTLSFRVGVQDADYLSSVTHLMSTWSDVLARTGITLESAASLFRAITAAGPTWSPAPHEKRSPAEQQVFYLWSRYRYDVHSIKHELSQFVSDASIVEHFEKFMLDLAKLLSDTIDLAHFSSSDNLSSEEENAFEEADPYECIIGRSFSVTKQGRICNGMHEVKEGDAIAALEGGDRLFILRPVGDKYRLVGDAYVTGLMFGEAYEGLDPDEVDYDIEIC
jgi:hypothetical protein